MLDDSPPEGRELSYDEVTALLAAYGLRTWPSRWVSSVEDTVAAAQDLGYPVALKTRDESLRHRIDLGGVRLDIGTEGELRAAYDAIRRLSDGPLEVQPMAPPGVAVVIDTREDPSFGALVSVGIGGVATELLGDQSFRALPLTDVDAREMVRSLRAAPVLFGWRGADPVDVAALEDALVRIARLADHLPEITGLALNPVLVSKQGLAILDARVQVAPPRPADDSGPRRLR